MTTPIKMFDFYRVDQIIGVPETAWSFLGKLVPLGTFALGILANRWLSRLDKRKKDRITIIDLLNEIELLAGPVQEQVKSVDDIILQLNSNKVEVLRFELLIQLKLDRIQVLDRTGVIDSLEHALGDRRMALEKANELFLGCEVLTSHYEEIQKIFKSFIEISSRTFERWRDETNELLSLIRTHIASVSQQHSKIEDDTFLDEVIRLTRPSLNEHKDIFELFEEMHKPLSAHMANHLNDPRVIDLSNANAKAMQSILALKREYGYTKSQLEKSKINLEKQYIQLQEIGRSLNFRA
mgnify:CR=1 FL=1